MNFIIIGLLWLLVSSKTQSMQSVFDEDEERIKEVSHLFIIDPQENTIALLKEKVSDLLFLPSCEIDNTFSVVALCDWFHRVTGLSIPQDHLMLIGRLECSAPKNKFLVTDAKGILSTYELHLEKFPQNEISYATNKILHYYYLWITDESQTLNAPVHWCSIPSLYELENDQKLPAITPPESLEIFKILTNFLKNSKGKHSPKSWKFMNDLKNNNIFCDIEIYTPPPLFNHYYSKKDQLRELAKKIDEENAFMDSLLLLPTRSKLIGEDLYKKCIVM